MTAGVTNSADFLSYCVMVHLLWPSRSQLYFNLTVESRLPLGDLQLSGTHKQLMYEDEYVLLVMLYDVINYCFSEKIITGQL